MEAIPDSDPFSTVFTSSDGEKEANNKINISFELAANLAECVLNHFNMEYKPGDYLNPMVRLNTKYEDRELVKIFGAKWNKDQKYWYMPPCDYFPYPLEEFLTDETRPLVVSFDS